MIRLGTIIGPRREAMLIMSKVHDYPYKGIMMCLKDALSSAESDVGGSAWPRAIPFGAARHRYPPDSAGVLQLTVPEHAGFVSAGCRGAGPLAPDLDPGLDQGLVYPDGGAQVGDLPVPGGVALVLAVAEGQACALGQQGSQPGDGLLQFGDRGGLFAGGQPSAQGGRRGR